MKSIILILLFVEGNLYSQNWFPSSVGNEWQYYIEYFTGSSIAHQIINYSIKKDTMIYGQRYFRFSKLQSGWLRLDELEKKLYIRGKDAYGNDTVGLYMDFNLAQGQTFLQFTPSTVPDYRTVTVIARLKTFWGISFSSKGFEFFTPPPFGGWEYGEWAINLGPIYFEENMQAIIHEEDSTIIFDHNYYPQFSNFVPILFTDTTVLSWNFNVYHHYSHFQSPGAPFSYNHIDSVYLDNYYMKSDSIIRNHPLNALVRSDFSSVKLSVNLNLNLINEGFDFYYKVIAKDKGIIPHYNYLPNSSEYYQLKYSPSTTIYEGSSILISKYFLFQNYPNPFNPLTSIEYSLAKGSYVNLYVYNFLGQVVSLLVNEYQSEGHHSAIFNGSNLSSGIYFYRLEAGDFSQTRKLILIK